MIRTLLAAYFALSTLVGPWVCCCLLRSVAPANSLPQTCCKLAANGKKSCCEVHEPVPQSLPENKPDTCPCRAEVRPSAVLAKAVEFEVEVQFWTEVAVLDTPDLSTGTVQTLTSRVGDPFADSVRMRLALLGVLRC